MLNSWMFYIILGLSASTIGLGWLSLSLHDDKLIAEQALVQAINVNSDMQKSLNLKGLSCQIDASSGAELIAEKNKIDEGISPVNSQLKDLAAVKKVTSKVVTVVAAKQETTKNESNFLPDDGFLVLMLQGCFATAGVQSTPTVTNVFPPDNLLVNPCRPTPAGESLIDLAIAQNTNVGCIAKWEKQMNKIRDNKAKQKVLYNVK